MLSNSALRSWLEKCFRAPRSFSSPPHNTLSKPQGSKAFTFSTRSRKWQSRRMKRVSSVPSKPIRFIELVTQRRRAQVFADVRQALLKREECGLNRFGVGVGNVAPH